MIFYLLLMILALQRVHEMSISRSNLERIQNRLASPLPIYERLAMIVIHVAWFGSTAIEYSQRGHLPGPGLFAAGMFLLGICQYVRYRTIAELGESWVAMPVVFHDQKLVTGGVYSWIRHPNYLVVILEIALVPALGSAFYTAAVFSVLNAIFLSNRIRIEERAICGLPDISEKYMKKKRLVPFIFLFFLAFGVANAQDVSIQSPSYDVAEKNPTYFKFIGRSSKLGIIGTSFSGYAKKLRLSYEQKGTTLESVKLSIEVDSLDTDNESRNEKMKVKCLSVSEFPSIDVQLEKALNRTAGPQEIPAAMTVRGKTIPILVIVDSIDGRRIHGVSSFKLSDAGIPDPSILVASVKDEFKIEFQVELPQE